MTESLEVGSRDRQTMMLRLSPGSNFQYTPRLDRADAVHPLIGSFLPASDTSGRDLLNSAEPQGFGPAGPDASSAQPRSFGLGRCLAPP
jgi:hypothetical protein